MNRDAKAVTKLRHILCALIAAGSALLLSGCKLAILNPKGIIAESEMRLLIESVLLMLIIVIPVLILVIVIAWTYRAGNKKTEYKPNWGHSNVIEIVCWTVPCIIIAVLAAMTWISTHKLSPYKPIIIKGKKQLTIQVVALDWKWLFIYPKQGIATVNYFHIPVGTPVQFQITSDAPMNSMEIPQLAGQIYAMGAMRTKLHIVASVPGVYDGFSTNYSGDGFAGMKFKVYAGSDEAFTKWVAKVKHSTKQLNYKTYDQLAQQSSNNPPEDFGMVQKGMFMDVIKMFTDPVMAKKFAKYKVPTIQHQHTTY
jgi:cytochrome o ubiquinol oxidase subunit 2